MNKWREMALGDLAEITSAKRIFYSEYVTNGVPFYRSKEVIDRHNNREIQTELFISNDKYESIKSNFGVPEEDDILLTSVGTLGIPYRVTKQDKFYFKDGNLTWFQKIDKKIIDIHFLYTWLGSKAGRQRLDEITIGSTQPALTIGGLKTINILLPPLPEQRAIASVLSSLDDKIDLLNRQNKTLEAMAETLFRQCFVEEAEEGWEEVDLEYVSEKITDGAHQSPPTTETGMPMASVKDMHQWGIDYSTCRKISQEDYRKLVRDDCRPLKNDILIAKDGSYLKHIFVTSEDMHLVVLSSIAIIRPNGKYHPILLSIFLKMDSTKELLKNIVTGAVIPRIVLKDFRKFPIVLPPIQKQIDALEIVEPIITKCYGNIKQIHVLEKLRDMLLPKLMSGEVRVKHECIDKDQSETRTKCLL